eukprot:gene1441-1816_t
MDISTLYLTNNSPSSITIEKITKYQHVRLDKNENGVAELVLCRPQKLNTMTDQFFNEFVSIFDEIQSDSSIRVVIIWAEGKLFTAGLDLIEAGTMLSGSNDDDQDQDPASQNIKLLKLIRKWQAAFDKINKCSKPVIAAVHNNCIGGGVDLITACDIRLCTKDSYFSIKETKLAIVADLGTLQRISRICGCGFAREMALTGERVDSSMALKFGLVTHVYDTKEILLEEARKLALQIASNSPLVVQSTKMIMNHADDHTIDQGLLRVALHNSIFLKSNDLNEAVASFAEKRTPVFKSKL